jgi:hypothetical protein
MEVVAVVGDRGQQFHWDVVGRQPRQRGQDGDCQGVALGEGADRLAPDPGDGALRVGTFGSLVQRADQPSAVALDADRRVLREVGAGLHQRDGKLPQVSGEGPGFMHLTGGGGVPPNTCLQRSSLVAARSSTSRASVATEVGQPADRRLVAMT